MYCPQCGKKLELTEDFSYEQKEYKCKSCGVSYETDYLGNLRLILPFPELDRTYKVDGKEIKVSMRLEEEKEDKK